MGKVPESAKKEISKKCPICQKIFKSKEFLVNHIETVHKEDIPPGWSASRYENYLRTGKIHGNCVVCKKKTDWNESTWKYSRLCGDKACSDKLSKNADKNMIKTYGKPHLLNDAEQQRKMIYSKRNSGAYYWSTDDKKQFKKMYASSVELKFLEMLDVFLNLEKEDVISPSPNTYVYKYNNNDHIYIPDIYISSINLEVELKEPKDNQNMHPKIQAIDKVKEKLKDDMMQKNNDVNYIKINGTDYREFFEYFNHLKNIDMDDLNTASVVNECFDDLNGNLIDNELQSIIDEIDQVPVTESDINKYLDNYFEKRLALYTHIDDSINSGLNFNKQIASYKKLIDKCDTYDDYVYLKKQLKLFRIQLKNIISSANGVSRYNDKNDRNELQFEANRALDKIDHLEAKLDSKMKKLEKVSEDVLVSLEQSDIYVTEGYDKNAWFQNVEESHIIGSKNGILYKPIFIFLSYTKSTMAKIITTVTDGTYNHSSISLDTSMTRMFSFNKQGFVDEDINYKNFSKTGSKYSVYMYLATREEYNIIENIISQFEQNRDNLKYSIKGLFNYLLKKETVDNEEWFCSEFVSYLLSTVNPNLLKRHYSLYSPDDLTTTRKLIKIYNGYIKDYDSDIIDREIRKILNRKGFENVTITNK